MNDFESINKWISVKEKFPKIGKKVLAYRPGMYYTVIQTIYHGNEDWENGYDISGNMAITHWMPIPEPPKKNDNK